MRWKSTSDRYGAVAIAMHWATAAAIAGLLVSGFQAAAMADTVSKTALLRIHAVIGVSILALTLLRIAWWWFADRKPDDPAATPRWQARTARITHGLFYVVIIGMAASGIGMIALSGAGENLFGSAARPLPDFTAYPPRVPHGIGGRFLVLLLFFHAGAALYHQFVLRDRLMARMGLGRPSAARKAVTRS